MKEIRTIRTVEVTEVKFVADDGKEFTGENAERNCEIYERQKDEKKVKESFDRLNAVRIPVPILDWFCEYADVWRIELESKKDYFTMTDYFKVVDGCDDDYLEMPKEFPYTMTVVKGYEYIDEYHGNLKKELEEALKQLC